MMRELFGREGGTCHGKGGSMHIADFKVGMLGANGVVGANILIAVGAAHAVRLKKGRKIVACIFGDGAINRGPFLEGLNWAGVWKLPILFVCEDNGFAATTRTRAMTAGEGPAARARASASRRLRSTAMTCSPSTRRCGGCVARDPRRGRTALPPVQDLSPHRPHRRRPRRLPHARTRWRPPGRAIPSRVLRDLLATAGVAPGDLAAAESAAPGRDRCGLRRRPRPRRSRR